MTPDERVHAIVGLGFTERQAGFLVMVMLHSGVCLARHYAAFAGIAQGQVGRNFFSALVNRRYATVRRCGHNTARLYHLHHRPLYAAIGEPDNRHRRPVPLSRAVERLMVLDAVLSDRELTWLATEGEKVSFFTLTHHVPPAHLPALHFTSGPRQTTRHFPYKLPIGIGRDGRTIVFAYLVTQSSAADFRLFLERHADLLRHLPAWTIRLLVPHHFAPAVMTYRAAFAQQLGSPLTPSQLDELRWFLRARQQPENGGNDERFTRAARAFGTARFRAVSRTWSERGDHALDAMISPALANAIDRQTGMLECRVLARRYLHLSPLVGTA